MARCKRCGVDLWPGRRVCYSCMKKWQENRTTAFNQAVEEIGPLGPDTLKAIQKRVKQIEKSLTI